MTTLQAAASKERLYVAQLFARPDFITVAGLNPADLTDETARAVYRVLATEGPAYAKPGPLIQALRDLQGATAELEAVEEIILLAPEPEEVTLDALQQQKELIEREAAGRQLSQRLTSVAAQIGTRPADEVVADARGLLDAYSREKVGIDHTARGIAQRLGQANRHIRWRCGSEDLDRAFQGIGPDGKVGYGMLAQGEVVVLAAMYGSGKTRIVNNWGAALLDQGASVAYLVLEDDDVSFATRLMAIHADVAPWKLEQHAAAVVGYLGEDGLADKERCETGLAWWNALGDRIRIYDGGARANIFKFRSARELLETDVALFGTTHVIIDYVNSWTGETHELEQYAYGLRAFASRSNVCVIEVSQFANDTIKHGSTPGQVATKGSGAWGAAAHVGLELVTDPLVGTREVGLAIKKARNAPRQIVYAQMNEETGRVRRYVGTPDYMALPSTEPVSGGKKGGGGKR